MTKLASALEGGLAGASTISLLTNALRNTNGNKTDTGAFNGKSWRKRFKKAGSEKPMKAAEKYIGMAGDLLGSTALLGLPDLHKKKKLLLRGALLGTATGLGAVWLRKNEKQKDRDGRLAARTPTEEWISKSLEVSLYTIGGLVAARLIQLSQEKKKTGKKKRKNR